LSIIFGQHWTVHVHHTSLGLPSILVCAKCRWKLSFYHLKKIWTIHYRRRPHAIWCIALIEPGIFYITSSTLAWSALRIYSIVQCQLLITITCIVSIYQSCEDIILMCQTGYERLMDQITDRLILRLSVSTPLHLYNKGFWDRIYNDTGNHDICTDEELKYSCIAQHFYHKLDKVLEMFPWYLNVILKHCNFRTKISFLRCRQ